MKKLLSLLLSLMLCLSLIPTQALAASDSDETKSTSTITEIPGPDEPDNPITVMCMAPGDAGIGEQPID